MLVLKHSQGHGQIFSQPHCEPAALGMLTVMAEGWDGRWWDSGFPSLSLSPQGCEAAIPQCSPGTLGYY